MHIEVSGGFYVRVRLRLFSYPITYYRILIYNPVAYQPCTHSILLLHQNTLTIVRSISTRLSLSVIKGFDYARTSQ